MANQHKRTIEFAGDYNLDNVFLHNHMGETTDIKRVMVELNIYESIYSNGLTGSIVVGDAQNLIGKLQINGTERISFKLSTPGTENQRDMVDASVETGHPFHIYKITDRRQLNSNTLLYTLHFASREFMRNLRTKVSQAYNGRLDLSVMDILTDENYLDSKKQISFEPCGNSDKIVIPNLRPYDAINMIAKRSLPEKSNGVGYYFYETTKGIYFRSWDNMVSVRGSYDRPVKQEFYYMPMNIDRDPNSYENKIQHDYQSVESYRFLNNFHDVAANTVLGTYAHNVITYNIFNKSYKKSDYNYEYEFANSKHTDVANEKSNRERYAIAASSFVDQDDKKISDYKESRVSLQPTTQFLHNEEKGAGYGIDVLQDGIKHAQGESQVNQVTNGTVLTMVVKGQSYLEAGDLIKFNMLSNDPSNPTMLDPQYSGKYIITKIRHQVNDKKYTMALECAKDSVRSGFSSSDFRIQRNNNVPDLRNTYSAEEPEPYGSS
tara:strand:+ start:1405 stop:2877 length:1473 start_codon:yes stop_codon:yes gene_type:complete